MDYKYRERIPYTLPDGTKRRKDIKANTKKELVKKRRQFEKDLERGLVFSSSNTLFSIYAQKWLDTKKKTVSPKQYDNYEGIIKNHLQVYIGNLKISEINKFHCQRIISELDCSESWAKHVRLTLYQIMEMALDEDLINKNPAKKLEIPKNCVSGKRRSITEKERSAIFAAAEYHKDGTRELVLLQCGLRPSEAARLTWSDIDFENATLSVRKSKTKAGIRQVPIPDTLLSRLRKEKAKTKSILVFTNSSGGQLTSYNSISLFKSFKRAVNIELGGTNNLSVVSPDLTSYCLRHTYCTDLQNAGVPINIAKYLLGHESITTTANIYSHFDAESDKLVREKLKMGKNWGNEKIKSS